MPDEAPRPWVVFVATAARETGALRIVTELARLAAEDHGAEYLFITRVALGVPGVRNEVVRFRGLAGRAWFEFFAIRRLLRNAGRAPRAVVSLNNLAILGALGMRQFVYIHQAIPFYPELRWGWGRRERPYRFYQMIYRRLMRLSLRACSARAIVQTPLMARKVRELWGTEALCWFPGFPPLPCPVPAGPEESGVAFLYPASDHPHKNHAVLVQAIRRLRALRPDLALRVRLVFTLPKGGIPTEGIRFVGACPQEEMGGLYQSAAALLFPSLVETVGLPLVEAASLGLPILAADLKYAREVLQGYPGASFLPVRDPEPWAQAMIALADRVLAGGRPPRLPGHRVALPPTRLPALWEA